MRQFTPLYPGIEFSSSDRIREVQDELLVEHLQYLLHKSPHYKKKLRGLDPRRVSMGNLAELPLTDKSELGNNCDEFLAAPFSRVVDIVFSSGTTGQPTKIMYTEKDLQRLAYNEEISLGSCGITADDVVLLTCTLDRCFIAGLAYFLGTRSLGAAAVRNGLNGVAGHLATMMQLRPSVIVGVPSFLLKLGQYLESKGVPPRETGVSKLVCIGEPVRDRDMSLLKMGHAIEDLWRAKVFSTYASSECVTSFCECTAQSGGHLHPNLAVVEIIDENGNVLPAGSVGEVALTPLRVEGMPLLRFRTGDVSFLLEGPCTCGRFSPRLGPILGRKKQMIKCKGTTFYPQAVYSVLDEITAVGDYYMVLSSNYDLSDQVQVFVSLKENSCTAESIAAELQARLRVRPDVVVASEEQVKEQVSSGNSRKIIRLIDRRQSNEEL